MAVKYRVQCPECGETFVWYGAVFPDFCPKCSAYVGVDQNFVPSKLNIGTHVSKGADQTYRAIERSSEVRAEMAGDPTLKITNMKDNLREGDVAAMVPQPSKQYTQIMGDASNALNNGQAFNPWMGGMGISSADAVNLSKSGPNVHGTGQAVLETIQGGTLPKVPSVASAVAGIRAGFGGGQR